MATQKIVSVKTVAAGISVVALLKLLKSLFSRSLFGLPREKFPLEEWVEQYEEDAFEPEVAIFDAHHHLFDPRVQPKGWPVSKLFIQLLYALKPAIANKLFGTNALMSNTFGYRSPALPPFMGSDLLRDIKGNGKGHNVLGTVYIECGWKTPGVEPVWAAAGEVDMVTQEHAKHPQILQGIVAFVDLLQGTDVEPVLKRYSQNTLVKGIRCALAWTSDTAFLGGFHAKKDMAFDPKFRAGFALLSKYNLSYDCWLYHEQVDALADLARCFPETTIICDHIGMPLGVGSYKASESLPKWKDSMKKLAKNSNVFVKIGGMGMRTLGFGFDERPRPPTSDELAETWAPYVHFVIDTFGVERCIMESNFPMDKISCSYTVLFNALKKIVRNFDKEDKRKLFELNGKRVYRVQ